MAGAGTDRLIGSRYNDTFRVEDGLSNLDSIEQIDGGAGYDYIRGTAASETLDFSSLDVVNVEQIDAGYGDDTVTGTNQDRLHPRQPRRRRAPRRRR